MVVAVDGLAPGNGLDGLGSLSLGEGWGKPEGTGETGEWGSMAWVVGREASVHLSLPPGPQVDFYGRGLPYPWAPGSPIQTVELLIGGRVVGRHDLAQGWADLRIPLPDDLPRGRILDLRLRFAHALKPENDARSLAAAFTQLAVIPRPIQDPKSFLEAHSFDLVTRRVVLPAGGGLRLPLAPASRVRLRLTDLLSRCEGCQLSVELTAPGSSPRPLLTEKRHDAPVVEVTFDTAPRGIHTLWIRADARQPGARGSLELVLGEIDLTRLETAGATLPHVFLYMIDTLRADELGPYGGRPALTPRVNAFAEEAVTYLDARATSSWTLPSVISLLTGLYPDRHGVMTGTLERDPERAPSLQWLLGRQGYRTVGISQSSIISPLYGVDTGFGSFYLYDNLNGRQLRSQEARALLASWLSQDLEAAPLFAYLHTVDPHAPYTPPAGIRGALSPLAGRSAAEEGLPEALAARGKASDPAEIAHLRALYQGEVRHADQELGRFLDLLKWLGLYEQSFVILVGDHGEEFAEHGGVEHGTTLFDEVLRVPLMVKYPGGRWAGGRVETPVSLVDVAPTVMAAHPDGKEWDFDGKVLPGPGDAQRRDQVVYFEIAPYRDPGAIPLNLRGLVVEGVKCIENLAGVDHGGRPAPRLEAFDLRRDAAEKQPLLAEARESVRCREVLEGWSRSRGQKVRQQRSHGTPTPEGVERLRALGYAN